MDFVLEQLEQGKERYQGEKYIATACNSGWTKLDKYYSKTSDSPAYAAAVVLHPSNKWQEIENSWCPEWIPPAKNMVKQFWESEHKPKVGVLSESSPNLTSTSTGSTDMAENTYKEWCKDRKRAQVPIDEYDRFIQSEIVCDIEDPRRWWLEETQQKVYPNLSKMALDMLSISAMSAEPERLFLGAKMPITDRRNRLGIESIEALECLKFWMGIQEFSDINFWSHVLIIR